MATVEINSNGTHVVVESDKDDIATVSRIARREWSYANSKSTPPENFGRGSAGFSIEKAPQWDLDKREPVRTQVGF